jgi:hypothetical protein
MIWGADNDWTGQHPSVFASRGVLRQAAGGPGLGDKEVLSATSGLVNWTRDSGRLKA